ncbi:MAG: DUF3667 domain-containing protein [Maribacter sp.]|nr:DUF3667 domain-containing protein [Maribacter sp.]
MPTSQCKNCDKTIDASFEYCPYCGQETADNLTFGVLFSNTIGNYFSIDARFFKSFFPLMLKPGVLARRFVDGKRHTYLHPAQFYLFISVIFFFIFSFTVRKADNQVSQAIKKGFEQQINLDSIRVNKDSLGIAAAKKALKDNQKNIGMTDEELSKLDSVMVSDPKSAGISFGQTKKNVDSLITADAPQIEILKAMGMKDDANAFTRRLYAQMLKFYENRGGGIITAFYDTIPIAMFLLLPLFAVFLKIFYWRRGTYAHHVVFTFYFFTFLFTAFCIMIVLNMIITIPTWIEFLVAFSFLLYLMIALRNFYRSSWFGAFLKANFISFFYLMLVVPTALVVIVLVSLMLY